MTTGLKAADFTSLRVLSGGSMQDILTLIGSGGGGGSGLVTSVVSPLSLSSGVLSVNLGSYSTTSQLNAMLANYSLTSSLLAQMTTNILTLRDGLSVDRNLQASQTGTLVFDGQAIATSNDLVGFVNTIDAGPGITVTGGWSATRTISSNLTVTAPLTISTVGTAMSLQTSWRPSTVTAGSGIFCLANDSAGTLQISATGSGGGQTEAQVKALIANGVTSNDALGRLDVLSSVGNGEVAFAVNDVWANSKQDKITGLVQNTPTGSVYFGPASIYPAPAHVYSWTNGTPSIFTSQGTHYDMYETITNQSGIYFTLQIDVKLVAPSTTWVMGFQFPNVVHAFTAASHGLNTSTFTTVSVSVTLAAATAYFYLGHMAATWYTGAQPVAGDVFHLQNFTILSGGATSSCDLNQDFNCSGDITCISLAQTSDRNVKDAIENLPMGECLTLLQGVSARKFIRTDLGEDAEKVERRVGMVAQEIESVMPSYWTNIVHSGETKSVSYDRLVCVLWNCLKDTNAQVAALTARVAALEL